eukprot:1607919-Amphidinium_carterae.2
MLHEKAATYALRSFGTSCAYEQQVEGAISTEARFDMKWIALVVRLGRWRKPAFGSGVTILMLRNCLFPSSTCNTLPTAANSQKSGPKRNKTKVPPAA